MVLPLLAFALFILAVWLSTGRRREALRTTGWCFAGVGLFALLDRRIGGTEIVNALVLLAHGPSVPALRGSKWNPALA